MGILLGEIFDWAMRRAPTENPPVLVAGHIEITWFLSLGTGGNREAVEVDEWLNGWELDDLFDRLELHNLGQPKKGYLPWVTTQYREQEFIGQLKKIVIWTQKRVYLAISGYDGIEGVQSWSRKELEEEGGFTTGYSVDGQGQKVSADPSLGYTFSTEKVLSPTSDLRESADKYRYATVSAPPVEDLVERRNR